MEARSRFLTWLVATLCLLAPLCAQDKFSVTAKLEPATAKPGDTVTLVIRAKVAEGWHAYGTKETTNLPVALKPAKQKFGGLEAVGEADVPPGSPHSSPIGTQYPLPQEFEVRQALKVPASMAAGAVTVAGELTIQVCDANMCLPPTGAKYEATLTVTGGAAAEPAKTAEPAKAAPKATPAPVATDPNFVLTASIEPAKARRGDTVTLVLHATVDEKYHAYGTLEPTNKPVALSPLKVKSGGLELVGDAEVPPGEKSEKMGFVQYPLPHSFVVKQQLRVPANAKPGTIEVSGDLDYQLCDENSCQPDDVAPFRAVVEIETGEGAASPATGGAAPTTTTTTPPTTAGPATAPTAPPASDNPFSGSWLALILACIGGGLFALAMPCTYPMIPITFSFFTKQAEKRGGNVLTLALTYGFGIVAMFVLVGVALSTVIIPIVNHWATNVVIGVMFFFFAFVLFGWIHLEPPQFLQRSASKASATGGYLGVFFMGATLVITSFTCTAPIVGSLLAKVAELGQLRVGIGMGIFGLTMAAPFVLLSLMPTKVKSMPKSGEWMETLKVSLGFVELAAAFKFVSMVDFAFGWQVLPRELFLLLWTAIFGLWALFLFGILRKAGTPNEGVSAGRMAGGMFVVLLATYFLFGALGYKLDFYTTNFIPGYSAQSVIARVGGGGESGSHAVGKHRIVLDDQPEAIRLAKLDDKLLLYNFTGFN